MRNVQLGAGSDGMRKVGAVVAACCLTTAAAIPIYLIVHWTMSSPTTLVESGLAPVSASMLAPHGALAAWKRVVGAAGGLIPGLLMSWGLLQARGALLAISAGHFFALEVVRGLKRYAGAALCSVIASFLLTPGLSILLTFGNPPGYRALAIGVSYGQIMAVLGASIIWVTVAALSRGAHLALENEQFV